MNSRVRQLVQMPAAIDDHVKSAREQDGQGPK
jgi:hypothetical protein